MQVLKEKINVDDNYCIKFGHLKKATVLYNYGRINDAHEELAKGIEII